MMRAFLTAMSAGMAAASVSLSAIATPMPGTEGSTGQACHEPASPYSEATGSSDYRQVQDIVETQAVSWDRLRLPRRLVGHDYRLREIFCRRDCPSCAWRPREPGRRLGLIVQKTHVCDSSQKACLRVTREISDRCNRFIQNQFSVVHSRLWRNSPDGSHAYQKYPYSDALLAEYGNLGPGAIVFDIRDCSNIRRLGVRSGTGELGLNFDLAHPPTAAERHRALEESLRQVPEVSTILAAPGRRDTAETPNPDRCMGQGPSLDETWNALETQDAQLEAAGEPPSED